MATINDNKYISMTAVADSVDEQINVTHVEWAVTGGAIGDEAILKDGAGDIVCHLVMPSANDSKRVSVFRECAGLAVTTLDSGILYVHKRG